MFFIIKIIDYLFTVLTLIKSFLKIKDQFEDEFESKGEEKAASNPVATVAQTITKNTAAVIANETSKVDTDTTVGIAALLRDRQLSERQATVKKAVADANRSM